MMTSCSAYNCIIIPNIFNDISRYIEFKDLFSIQLISKKLHILVQQELSKKNHDTIVNREYLATLFLRKNYLLQFKIQEIIRTSVIDNFYDLTSRRLPGHIKEIIYQVLLINNNLTIEKSIQFVKSELVKWIAYSYPLLDIKQIGQLYTFQNPNQSLLSYIIKDISKNIFSKKRKEFLHSPKRKIIKNIRKEIFNLTCISLKNILQDFMPDVQLQIEAH